MHDHIIDKVKYNQLYKDNIQSTLKHVGKCKQGELKLEGKVTNKSSIRRSGKQTNKRIITEKSKCKKIES